MIIKIKKIILLPNKSKLMAFKVLFLLHKYWLISNICSFKYLARNIGIQGIELKSEITIKEKRFLIFIKKIFDGINQHWIYNFKCLLQVLAASQLLRNKHIPYTLFLGIKKEKNIMKAHAWLKSNEIYVTGSIQDDFEVVTFFSYMPSD